MGVKGTQGRCYGFFADLKECQVKTKFNALLFAMQLSNNSQSVSIESCSCIKETVREDLKASKEDNSVKRLLVGGICDPHRIDYFECLHSFKENQRIKKVMDEMQRQEYEAKYGPPPENQH